MQWMLSYMQANNIDVVDVKKEDEDEWTAQKCENGVPQGVRPKGKIFGASLYRRTFTREDRYVCVSMSA